MYSRFVLLITCLAVCNVQGKVMLTKGRNETVSFKGEELTIDVDNTLGANAELIICFGSSPDASHPPCPLGYALFLQAIGGNRKVRFIINRQGQFVEGSLWLTTIGSVKFNDDGTLNIMVLQLPDAKTAVTLPNAEIFVPEKQVDTIVKKKRSNVGYVGIIAIIIVLIVICLIIGILVWFCLIRKPTKVQTTDFDYKDASPSLQQMCHQKRSTDSKSSTKIPISCVSNMTMTTVQTTVSPKQVTYPSKSPSKGKPRNVTTSMPRPPTNNKTPSHNRISNHINDNSESQYSKRRPDPARDTITSIR